MSHSSSGSASILAINGGSSSIKFALFEGESLRRILVGGLDRIGLGESTLRVDGESPEDHDSHIADAPDYAAAVGVLLDWFEKRRERLSLPSCYRSRAATRHKGCAGTGFTGCPTFLMRELARLDGAASARGRVILAHLGNGASLAAVHGGKPIDTSMSFTPTGGIPMGTRSGDLDPGLLGYLARSENLSTAQLDELVTSESGLLGMSETSSDMSELLAREGEDVRAKEAIAVFCYQIKKWIGAYAADSTHWCSPAASERTRPRFASEFVMGFRFLESSSTKHKTPPTQRWSQGRLGGFRCA